MHRSQIRDPVHDELGASLSGGSPSFGTSPNGNWSPDALSASSYPSNSPHSNSSPYFSPLLLSPPPLALALQSPPTFPPHPTNSYTFPLPDNSHIYPASRDPNSNSESSKHRRRGVLLGQEPTQRRRSDIRNSISRTPTPIGIGTRPDEVVKKPRKIIVRIPHDKIGYKEAKNGVAGDCGRCSEMGRQPLSSEDKREVEIQSRRDLAFVAIAKDEIVARPVHPDELKPVSLPPTIDVYLPGMNGWEGLWEECKTRPSLGISNSTYVGDPPSCASLASIQPNELFNPQLQRRHTRTYSLFDTPFALPARLQNVLDSFARYSTSSATNDIEDTTPSPSPPGPFTTERLLVRKLSVDSMYDKLVGTGEEDKDEGEREEVEIGDIELNGVSHTQQPTEKDPVIDISRRASVISTRTDYTGIASVSEEILNDGSLLVESPVSLGRTSTSRIDPTEPELPLTSPSFEKRFDKSPPPSVSLSRIRDLESQLAQLVLERDELLEEKAESARGFDLAEREAKRLQAELEEARNLIENLRDERNRLQKLVNHQLDSQASFKLRFQKTGGSDDSLDTAAHTNFFPSARLTCSFSVPADGWYFAEVE